MIPEFSDEEKNTEKDLIIARSPLLKAFIDPLLEIEPETWYSMFSAVLLEKGRDLAQVLGEKIQNDDINVYINVSKQLGTFDRDVSDLRRFALIASFAWIGYEIGDKEKIPLFLDDIMCALSAHEGVRLTQETQDFFEEVINLGILWRRDINNETPDRVRDGIAKLDLDL